MVIVEDLVSTGGSSLKAAQAVRNAGGEVIGMVAIFTYEFPVSVKAFKDAGVKLLTISNYSAMIAAAKEIGSDYIVVGRPITAAADPVAAYERCVAEFCD